MPRKTRHNPLKAKPPAFFDDGRSMHQHRMGRLAAQEAQAFALRHDPHAVDIYEGVHVTPHAVVAAAYAWGKSEGAVHNARAWGEQSVPVRENEYGLIDVVDPPVLIGLRRPKNVVETIDADGYSQAKSLYDFANATLEMLDDEPIENVVDDIFGEDMMNLREHVNDGIYYPEAGIGMSWVGGDLGNRPSFGEVADATVELVEEAQERGDDEVDEERAFELAREYMLQRQSRWLKDVPEDLVVCIFVPKTYEGAHVEDMEHLLEPMPEEIEGVDEANGVVLGDGVLVWGDLSDVDVWHGTSLSYAEEALPGIFTPALVQEVTEAGSLYDLAELAREAEDWDDEDGDED